MRGPENELLAGAGRSTVAAMETPAQRGDRDDAGLPAEISGHLAGQLPPVPVRLPRNLADRSWSDREDAGGVKPLGRRSVPVQLVLGDADRPAVGDRRRAARFVAGTVPEDRAR